MQIDEPDRLIDDRWPRAIGIPVFGVGIPLVFGLYGHVPFGSPGWLFGQALFLGLAFALWQGNRYLLFATAARVDWLERPARRVARLLLGIVLFTAPLTIAVLGAWTLVGRGEPLRASAIQGVVLTNVICVVFVTHVYETVLLLKARESDRVRVAEVERARAESELLALRRQVDPHFLFNCLNTLQALIDEDVLRARAFNESLAAMLRYLLDAGDRHLVPLAEELAFVERYRDLSAIRFGEALRVEVVERAPPGGAAVPPTSIQLLLENAIAHNRLSSREPLVVSVELGPAAVTVSHARRPKEGSRGAGTGLKNLAERLRLASGAQLEVLEEEARFTVRFELATTESAGPALGRVA